MQLTHSCVYAMLSLVELIQQLLHQLTLVNNRYSIKPVLYVSIYVYSVVENYLDSSGVILSKFLKEAAGL